MAAQTACLPASNLRRGRRRRGIGVVDLLASDDIRGQRGITRLVLPRLNIVRRCRPEVGRGLIDIGLLQLELRLGLLALRHRGRELRPGLSEPVLVIARIDLDQQLPGRHLLVVLDENPLTGPETCGPSCVMWASTKASSRWSS